MCIVLRVALDLNARVLEELEQATKKRNGGTECILEAGDTLEQGLELCEEHRQDGCK